MNEPLEPFTYDDVNERRTQPQAEAEDGPARAPERLNFAQKILREIRTRRNRDDTHENEAHISGLKRALELYLGTDEARQYLTDNGESSN